MDKTLSQCDTSLGVTDPLTQKCVNTIEQILSLPADGTPFDSSHSLATTTSSP